MKTSKILALILSMILIILSLLSCNGYDKDYQGLVFTLKDDGTYKVSADMLDENYAEILSGEINIPSTYKNKSVTSIGDFYRCSNLTSITIPDSVHTIDDQAFLLCEVLTNLTLPNSITSIGKSTFAGCSKLTSLTFNGTKAQWDAIDKKANWKLKSSISKVICTDGEISV